ncbi:hypothetical protein BESB_011010 [Besnoitia besnoiti]|uniref:Transmembrane protein n=1 Tax=Besnoitia besnoiti TaxID=94643 RepID=A0A2A9MLB4_BESBE|nr:hypothetical protein BESB_011010 [Besnoitia besnoiti]PFH38759.1 hypothetical protein BESB_011010 [Besnoitia besnoiti]
MATPRAEEGAAVTAPLIEEDNKASGDSLDPGSGAIGSEPAPEKEGSQPNTDPAVGQASEEQNSAEAAPEEGEQKEADEATKEAEEATKEAEDTPPAKEESKNAEMDEVTKKLVVDRVAAEERVKHAKAEVDSKIKKAAIMAIGVMLLFVALGMALMFCFSPLYGFLAFCFIVGGLVTGVIGLIFVCCRTRAGTLFYLFLVLLLLVLLVAVWAFYAFMFYKATLVAIAAGKDEVNSWVEDQTNSVIPEGLGGSFPSLKPGELGSLVGGLTGDLLPPEGDKLDDDIFDLGVAAEKLEACKEGIEDDGTKYLDSVTSVFLALSSYGQMCSYSHRNILQFKKWQYGCRDVCEFRMLNVGHKLTMDNAEDRAVIKAWNDKLATLPINQKFACAVDALSTSCAVENSSYEYILLGVIGLFLLAGCCGCVCCIPSSMKATTAYSKALKKYNAALRESAEAAKREAEAMP